MKALGHYAIAAILIVAAGTGALWPFLDPSGRAALVVAAAVALPVQLATFLLMLPGLRDPSRFMVRWGVGMLIRMGVVAVVGLLLPRLHGLDGGVLLLSVCGFFFALLLLEPAFFRSKGTARFAQ